MFATAIILFREVLEASLVIAIILGASRSVPGRIRWVSGGIALGVAGAALVAIFADRINSAFSGSGQALFNAIILLAAVTMLGWHNVWMSTHGKKMTTDIKNLGEKIQRGSEPPVALLVISFVAVMREGSEAVLFLWAIAAGGAHHIPMISGGLLGIAAGALSGFFLYRGLLRIPVKHFFTVTNFFILLLAAGLAAQAAGFLNQAGLVPSLGNEVWDTSRLLNQTSIAGQLLHILVGYTARPMGIQILFYLSTMLILLLLMRLARLSRKKA